jgi:hypothetical protein
MARPPQPAGVHAAAPQPAMPAMPAPGAAGLSTALVPAGASMSTALVPAGATPGGGVQSVVPYGAGAPGGGAVVPFGMGGGSAVQALVAANPFLAQALAPMIQARQQAMTQMLAPQKPQVHAPPSRIFIGSVRLLGFWYHVLIYGHLHVHAMRLIPKSVNCSKCLGHFQTFILHTYILQVNIDITEGELRQVFGSFGDITNLCMIPNPENGKHRGYGFIDFEKKESATVVCVYVCMCGAEMYGFLGSDHEECAPVACTCVFMYVWSIGAVSLLTSKERARKQLYVCGYEHVCVYIYIYIYIYTYTYIHT